MHDRVVYLGHATTLIEIDGIRVLTDPVLRDRILHLRRIGAPFAGQLGDVDAILISHGHADHLDPPSLKTVGRALPLIVPRGLGGILKRRGFSNVEEISVGETARIGSLQITAVPASHDGQRWPIGRRVEALGYVVEGGSRAYFAGDTDLFDEMDAIGSLDLAFLPVAGWGPRIGRGHLDPARAATATGILEPRIVVPIHWGTLHSSRRPPKDPGAQAREFKRLVGEGDSRAEVRILEPGESTSLDGAPQRGRDSTAHRD
jgi:L-ascorbate metabolism protein UlaG (beta-lactamase superfamily)